MASLEFFRLKVGFLKCRDSSHEPGKKGPKATSHQVIKGNIPFLLSRTAAAKKHQVAGHDRVSTTFSETPDATVSVGKQSISRMGMAPVWIWVLPKHDNNSGE